MARKKEPPKPLSDLRFDFVASLENVCNQSMMLLQICETLARDDKSLNPHVRAILAERTKALRDALLSGDDT